jgi:hypothetical protein
MKPLFLGSELHELLGRYHRPGQLYNINNQIKQAFSINHFVNDLKTTEKLLLIVGLLKLFLCSSCQQNQVSQDFCKRKS